MKPLQAVGLGLIIVIFEARPDFLGGWDVYLDPVAWVLILLGAHRLPMDLDHRRLVLALGWLSALASVPLSVPGVAEWFDAADPSLSWAASLPALGFVALLSHALANAATQPTAKGWLRTVVAACVVVAVAPVLVFGAGIMWLETPAGVAAGVALVLPIWLFFTYSGRPWAGAPPIEQAEKAAAEDAEAGDAEKPEKPDE